MLSPDSGPASRFRFSRRGLAAACAIAGALAVVVGSGSSLQANEHSSDSNSSAESSSDLPDVSAASPAVPAAHRPDGYAGYDRYSNDMSLLEGPGSPVPKYGSIDIDDLPLHETGGEESGRASQHLQVVTRGTLARGQSLGSSLHSHGVSAQVVDTIAREMRGHFNFRRAQPGHQYRLAQDADGQVLDFRYNDRPDSSLHLWRSQFGFSVKRESVQLFHRTAQLSGKIQTSLYKAIRDAGEHSQLANDFADIFAWDLDFTRVVHSGDDFQILYERLYQVDDDGNEVYVRPGQILAAHFGGQAGALSAIYFDELGEGLGSYFRPDGSAVERHFLVAPLKFSRISSQYTSSRRHPILKVTRPHHGIDYAAPEGTPIFAIADGTVIHRGWAGGFGNLMKVRHVSGYVSYYAHLSRFPDDIKLGQHVKQKQVIGYVGHTGLATGDHVCFRIAKDGDYVNPMKLKGPDRKGISEENWSQFTQVRDQLLSRLQMSTALVVDEAL